MDFTWLGIQICICWSQISLKESRGVDQKTSQYLVDHHLFTWCISTHLLRIELIRLLSVACGVLSHSSSMAVRSCWILVGTGTVVHVDTEHPKNTQWVTCLVSMQAMEELVHFQLPEIVYRSLPQGALSCWNLRWWRGIRGTPMGLRISSWYLCAFKLPSIKYNSVHCP